MLQFARNVEQPGEVGHTLGQNGLLESEEDEVLNAYLGLKERESDQFVRGFVAGRVFRLGREWGEAKLADDVMEWSPAQRAKLLTCLPEDSRTWDIAEAAGPETERLYWRYVYPFSISGSEDSTRAVRKLLVYEWPFTAIKFLSVCNTRKRPLPASLVADALDRALQAALDEEPLHQTFHHDVAVLLDSLEGSNEIEKERIATLEWGYLPLFKFGRRRPKTLHSELARNPDFFAEAIFCIYRAEGDESYEDSGSDQQRVLYAYDLVSSWRTVPGANEEGSIDAIELKGWVKRARQAIADGGRGTVGDGVIGQMLSASPAGPDGAWPHPAVRDVIEEVGSRDLEDGIVTGIYNSRGVVSKHPYEGGAQERGLADRYADFAAELSVRWPRTAATLRRIEQHYRSEAQWADQEAELREDLNR